MFWFVYSDASYYPSAKTVEADTPEDAVKVAGYDEWSRIFVFPSDALAYRFDPED